MHPSQPRPFATLEPAVRIRFDATVPAPRDRAVWVAAGVVALSLLSAYVLVLRGAVSHGALLHANFAQNLPAKRLPAARPKPAPAPSLAAAQPR
jgi:hypothetical protein